MTVLPFGNASKYLMNVLMLLVSMWSLFHRWRLEFFAKEMNRQLADSLANCGWDRSEIYWGKGGTTEILLGTWWVVVVVVVEWHISFVETYKINVRFLNPIMYRFSGLFTLLRGRCSIRLVLHNRFWGWQGWLLKDCKGSYYFGPSIFCEGPYPPKNVGILVVTVTSKGRIP